MTHTYNQHTDKALFSQIATGDEQAFALLMDKYWNLLYSQAIAYLLHLQHEMEVFSVVIYIGNKKLNMPDFLSMGDNHFKYRIIDIREMSPELFLNSDNPKEVIFALLAGNNKNKALLVKRIIAKLHDLLPGSESKLRERLKELRVLGNLRGNYIQKLIKKEIENMPIIFDVRKDLFYQDGLAEGVAKGIVRGMAKGEAAGIAKSARRTAEKMLKDGMNIKQVSKYTNLPLSELNTLAKKLRN